MIIGHAGGDPVNFCENTLASTRSALKNGANAIEVDVAISKDNVVFLWHDPYPLGIVALARRWANYTYGPFIFVYYLLPNFGFLLVHILQKHWRHYLLTVFNPQIQR